MTLEKVELDRSGNLNIMSTHCELAPMSSELKDAINRIERDILRNQSIQANVLKDMKRLEDNLREAQNEGNREVADIWIRSLQKTSEDLSEVNERLLTLEKRLEKLNSNNGFQMQSQSSKLGQARWRLASKKMFAVCRDPKFQNFFEVTLRKFHGAILNTIADLGYDLRAVQFKVESGQFNGRCFSTIFR